MLASRTNPPDIALGYTRAMEPDARSGAEPPTITSSLTRGLDHVYYWVTDMDRAVAFYRDVLGLPLVRRDGRRVGRVRRRRRPAGAARRRPRPRARRRAARPRCSWWTTWTTRAAALTARGVTFGHEGGVEGYARFLAFTDPDGNTVQIIEYEPAGD